MLSFLKINNVQNNSSSIYQFRVQCSPFGLILNHSKIDQSEIFKQLLKDMNYYEKTNDIDMVRNVLQAAAIFVLFEREGRKLKSKYNVAFMTNRKDVLVVTKINMLISGNILLCVLSYLCDQTT